METTEQRETRGSGSDANSDAGRLRDADNYRDKAIEDTFPASDPPATTARVSWRERKRELLQADSVNEMEKLKKALNKLDSDIV